MRNERAGTAQHRHNVRWRVALHEGLGQRAGHGLWEAGLFSLKTRIAVFWICALTAAGGGEIARGRRREAARPARERSMRQERTGPAQ